MYNVHELQWYGFIYTWSRSWLWLRLTRQKRWQAAVSGESGATQGCVTQCVVPSTLRRSLGLPDVSIQLERCHIAGDTMQVAFFRFWDEFQKFLAAQSSGWSFNVWRVFLSREAACQETSTGPMGRGGVSIVQMQDVFSTILSKMKVRGRKEVMDTKLTSQRKERRPIQQDLGRGGRDRGSVQSKKYENHLAVICLSYCNTYTLRW